MRRNWERGAVTTLAALLLTLASACPSASSGSTGIADVGRCRLGTLPCGKGCMPLDAACCDDGTRRTSSYCTNSAGGGCRVNAGSCKTPAPGLSPVSNSSGPAAAFCCAPNSDEGSFDCAEGQHHCGLSCVPESVPCCPKSATNSECPYSADLTINGVTCLPHPGVLCGVIGDGCASCPSGECCAGNRGSNTGFQCLASTGVCTGTQGNGSGSSNSGGSGSGGNASNCRLVWDCGASSQCAQVYGASTGSAAEPDAATCEMVCQSQGACTCQGC